MTSHDAGERSHTVSHARAGVWYNNMSSRPSSRPTHPRQTRADSDAPICKQPPHCRRRVGKGHATFQSLPPRHGGIHNNPFRRPSKTQQPNTHPRPTATLLPYPFSPLLSTLPPPVIYKPCRTYIDDSHPERRHRAPPLRGPVTAHYIDGFYVTSTRPQRLQ